MTSSSTSSARRFRALLQQADPVLLPGAYDALTARLIEDAGFDGVYLGGFAAGAAGLGVADHSLITMTEILDAAQRVTSAVDVPVIADLDDAGGNAVNVGRFVRLAERVGLAGVHIEDIVAGKHFGGHPDTYVDVRTFADRIRAATDARIDDDFVIIARSDTKVVEEMIERCLAAVGAGADMIFLPHLRRRDVVRVQQECSAPMMQIGTSRTPASESGAKVVIFPGDLLFASFDAVRESLERLRGGIADPLDGSVFTELNRIIGSPEATSAAERYGVRPLAPDSGGAPSP